MLDEFEGLGLHCEPSTQLVVTCEVCGRPSTKDCWTCGMRICDFCTLKRHWKVCALSLSMKPCTARQHPTLTQGLGQGMANASLLSTCASSPSRTLSHW